MMRNGQRTIKVKKSELLNTLRRHMENHIAEYAKAVKAYRLEAMEQLEQLMKDADAGELGLKLHLTEPMDNSANYVKIITMFEWEVEEFVELSQDEFKEYVLDENNYANMAKMSNSMYLGKLG